MSNTMIWVAIGVGEILLVVFGLLIVAWIRSVVARRRDREAVRELVAKIGKRKSEREAAIQQFLGQNYQLDGDVRDKAATGIARAELRLIQEVANLYSRREGDRLVQFPLAVEAAVEPYWELEGAAGATDAGAPAADDAELARLRDENRRLSDELQITMDTMSRMLSEYSAMFAGATPEQVAGSETSAVSGEITSTGPTADNGDATDVPIDDPASADSAGDDEAVAVIAGSDDTDQSELEQILSDSGNDQAPVDTAVVDIESAPDADDLFDAAPAPEPAAISADPAPADATEALLDTDELFDAAAAPESAVDGADAVRAEVAEPLLDADGAEGVAATRDADSLFDQTPAEEPAAISADPAPADAAEALLDTDELFDAAAAPESAVDGADAARAETAEPLLDADGLVDEAPSSDAVAGDGTAQDDSEQIAI